MNTFRDNILKQATDVRLTPFPVLFSPIDLRFETIYVDFEVLTVSSTFIFWHKLTQLIMIIITSLQVNSNLKDLSVDGRMFLNWRLNRKGVMELGGIHLSWERDRWQSLVNTNEPSAVTKKREFLSYLRNH